MENKNSKTELIPKTDSKNETILINNKSISKPNDKQSFLIYHTLIAKGIASLMLLYHHLLREGNKFNKGFYNELIIFNINFRKYISIFFKITTCSYTFLSGIGLYYSLIKLKSIKEMYKKCMKNFFRLMVIFWIILIFVFPKGLKTGLFNLKYSTIISCIFGIYGRKGNWWYIRMHFALFLIKMKIFFIQIIKWKQIIDNISNIKDLIPNDLSLIFYQKKLNKKKNLLRKKKKEKSFYI